MLHRRGGIGGHRGRNYLAGNIALQARKLGITVPLLGGDGWDSSDLDVKAADGGFYSNHYDPGDTRPIGAKRVLDDASR